MNPRPDSIPVIDLFAGPGGLGEGFSAVGRPDGRPAFRIGLSVEKDPSAHRTLSLRAFYRRFPAGHAPEAYYDYLRHPAAAVRQSMLDASPRQAAAAAAEAWHATLGTPSVTAEIDRRITTALAGEPTWVLIGGPPCQAYSLAGRSRVGGIDPADPRVYLYREYLRTLARHAPPVFVTTHGSCARLLICLTALTGRGRKRSSPSASTADFRSANCTGRTQTSLRWQSGSDARRQPLA